MKNVELVLDDGPPHILLKRRLRLYVADLHAAPPTPEGCVRALRILADHLATDKYSRAGWIAKLESKAAARAGTGRGT